MLKRILAISGKPGLFRLVSKGRNMLIVETLDEQKKRMPARGADKVTSLSDISMYTDGDDVPLYEVLTAVMQKEQGAPVAFDPKKASARVLQEYFACVLPNYDRERVYNNDIKKLLLWYNILVANGFTAFNPVAESEPETETEA